MAHIATRIREADSTQDAAGALTELTAAHDGILAGLAEVLVATAKFYQGLGQPADLHAAQRLRYLAAERIGVVWSDLRHTRNELADRHEPHPQRKTCGGEADRDEREASTVCACPTSPPRVPAAPAAGRRR